MKFSLMADKTIDEVEWATQPETPTSNGPLSEYLRIVVPGQQDTNRDMDCPLSVQNDDDVSTDGLSTASDASAEHQPDMKKHKKSRRVTIVAPSSDMEKSKSVKSQFQKIEDLVQSIKELSYDMDLSYEDIAEALVQPEELHKIADEQQEDKDAQKDTDLGPLHFAARNNNTRILEVLLKNGANINARGGSGFTALHVAARKGNFEALKMLALHPDMDLDARDEHGCSALTQAIRVGSFPCALLLVSKGADVDVVTRIGSTALHYACTESNMEELVTQLSAKSKKVNFQNEYGNTALHLAINTKNWDYIAPLVDAGADLNIKNRYGRTPMHQACLLAPTEVLLDLVQKDVDFTKCGDMGDTVLHILCYRDLCQLAEMVVSKQGVDINVKTNWGITPLMVAVLNKREDTVRMLVKQKADVNIRNKDSDTALTIAIREGHDDIAEFLIANGSPINPQNQSLTRHGARLEQKRQAEEVYAALSSAGQKSTGCRLAQA